MQLTAYKDKLPDVFYQPKIKQGDYFAIDKSPYPLPTSDITFLHYHNCYEIGICEKGNGIFVCEDKIRTLKPGDVTFIPATKRHYSKSIEKDNPCLCRFLSFNAYELLCCLGISDNEKTANFIYDIELLNFPYVFSNEEYPDLNELLKKIIFEYDEYGEESAEMCSIYFYEFILKIQKKTNQNHNILVGSDKRIETAVKYITLHYGEVITLKELSARCFVSESQLGRLFVKQYGIPPIKWLNSFRVSIAKQMLVKTDYSVAEICEKSGFKNPSDLYRHFIKETGISPNKYRNIKNRCC